MKIVRTVGSMSLLGLLAGQIATQAQTQPTPPPLTLSLARATVLENAGTLNAAARVTLNAPTSAPLDVSVISNMPERLGVPSTVTIPAGASSVVFPLTPVDNDAADGRVPVTIQVLAPKYTAGSAVVTVVDDETLLHAKVKAVIPENAGTIQAAGVVAVKAPVTTPLTVSLTSNNAGKLSVPATVTIPAGASQVTFPVTVVDDTIVAGPIKVIIRVTAQGFTGAAVSVVVGDNEAKLHVGTPSPTLPENSGTVAGVVSRNTPVTAPLTVRLISDNPGKLSVPSTVTIPAGASSVTFPMTVVDDTIVNDSLTVNIRVAAVGFVGASVTVTVTDND